MAALTSGRNTALRKAELLILPVKGATKIFEGSLVAVKAGFAIPGKLDAAIIAVGRAEEFIENTGADGEAIIKVRRGCFKFENDAAKPVTNAQLLQDCYIVDDQTVSSSHETNTRSRAGKVIEVEPDGVWIEIV